MHPVKIADFKDLAKQILPEAVFDFIDGGACDEITKNKNREAFDAITMKPFCLRNVATLDTSTNIMGFELPIPFMIAPTAFHQLVAPAGEVSTAKAAKAAGITMIVSCMSNRSLEEIALCSRGNSLWLQVYLFKDRALTESLIHRAEQAGYKALVLTVGVPISGKRDRDVRNQFSLPSQLTTGNFISNVHNEVIYNFTAGQLDPSLTWEDITWVQSITQLPIILKGILNPVDAETACTLQIAGIVVSNHGGRQLDTAEASITALPDIVNTVAGRMLILLDGSIERGTDILKALALGADAVLIGRPVLWALAVGGVNGLKSMLDMVRDEFEMAMKLTGCPTINAIKQFKKSLNFTEIKR